MSDYQPVPVRRGSIVGPLLLLVLGVLFLLHNLRPDISFARLAQYWPYLLIFWGAARLVEYLVGRATGRPVASTLSGGEIFLAVLLCLLGSASGQVRGRDWQFGIFPPRGADWFGETFRFEIRAERTLPPNAALLIQNPEGDVTITGVDGNRLAILAKKSVRAVSRSAAEEADRETSLDISEQAGRLVIRANQDRVRDGRRVSVDLEIQAPKAAAIALEGRSGELDLRDVGAVKVHYRRANRIHADGVKGDVELDARGRDVSLQNVTGAVSISGSYSGEIQLQNVGQAVKFTSSQTTLSVEKLAGRMQMEPSNLVLTRATGPLRLQAGRRDVRIEDFSRDLEVRLKSGDIELRPEKGNSWGEIRAETGRGDLRLSVPAGARFQIQGNANRGSIINDLGAGLRVEQRGQGARVEGGSGGPVIHLSTGRGDIALRRTD